jgi:Tol biopolymer transport system component
VAAAAAVLVLAWFLRPPLPPPEVTGTRELTHDNGQKVFLGELFPLVSDGSRIYFPERSFSEYWLYEISTDGGEAERLKAPNLGELRDISPLRPQLLLQAWDGILWTVVVPGGQPHRIGNLTTSDAAWSPDGATLYFVRDHSIFSAAPDGSNAHKLLTVEGDPSWMRFSPDGRVLRFTVTTKLHQGITSLWEAQADGSHLHQLLPGFTDPASDCCGSWTPDGKYFVFRAARDGTSALWTMREVGDWSHKVSHAPVRLTQAPLGAYFPLPGKDGKVYFAGAMPRGELTRYDSKTRSLSLFLGGISASGLTFSKDGKHLVYMSYPDDELWYGNSDGSGLRQLTFPPMHGGMVPRISPDGSRVAFTANMPGKPPQIYVIPVDGGEPEAITSGSQGGEDPIWSPSGDALLYGPWTLDNTTNAPTALEIVNLKTRAVTSIPGSSGLFSPKWSPDGRYLVALMYANMQLKLFDMNLHTWQGLAGDTRAGYPEWTPDSKCVVFGVQKDADKWEYRVCLADRKIQPIADMAASGKLVEAFGSWEWTGLAPDGSILALRDASTQEIYALDVDFP